MTESTPISTTTSSSSSETGTSKETGPATLSKPSSKTIGDAIQDISIERMRNIGKVPCGRDSLLYGIGGGLAVGAGRFIVKRKAMTASNWAVGAFAIISIGCWEWCNYQRLQHAKKVGVVVEKLNQLEEKRRQEGTAITTTTTTTSDDDAN